MYVFWWRATNFTSRPLSYFVLPKWVHLNATNTARFHTESYLHMKLPKCGTCWRNGGNRPLYLRCKLQMNQKLNLHLLLQPSWLLSCLATLGFSKDFQALMKAHPIAAHVHFQLSVTPSGWPQGHRLRIWSAIATDWARSVNSGCLEQILYNPTTPEMKIGLKLYCNIQHWEQCCLVDIIWQEQNRL